MGDMTPRYRQLRKRSLARLALLRAMHAPSLVIRREQLFAWGIRQWHQQPAWRGRPVSLIPGYERNEARFLGIFAEPAGRA